ncbi:LOW QUALITY PROTEIN: hypothetical protein Cgig2_011492 [Carnegiea gigantea]|uniref:Uncharacterized protein n=1 Tax=Carnegiea gigantea TaxID=171969 RepID=A0A9Q1GXY6_9CARY|nr:LOW QUALITY PROTEIN: hypothetical protein Cgig2_011492 [Carnegiea gigantea]
MPSRNFPNVPKNTAQESSEKTITDIHQQPSEETDGTVTPLIKCFPLDKMMNLSLMMKTEIPKEEEDVQKSATVPVEGPKSMQSVLKPAEGDTKHKKIFQSRMSPSGFVGMIDNFNEGKRKAIQDMGFRGFLHLQVTELPGDLCKWLVDIFDPYSVTLYISPEKRIGITPMDVYLTLTLPIGGRKVEEFYGKKPKDAKYNEVLDAWRKD